MEYQWSGVFWYIETWLDDRQQYLPTLSPQGMSDCEEPIYMASACGDDLFEVSENDMFWENAIEIEMLTDFTTMWMGTAIPGMEGPLEIYCVLSHRPTMRLMNNTATRRPFIAHASFGLSVKVKNVRTRAQTRAPT